MITASLLASTSLTTLFLIPGSPAVPPPPPPPPQPVPGWPSRPML
ncbi:hypothetical protein [Elstera sp.]|jgi:hypothetical protein